MNDTLKKPKILIIEDDEHINQILYDGLVNENFICTQAYSGSEGRMNAAHCDYQLILLDLMLPGGSGEEFMSFLRTDLKSRVPVIILSAKDQLDHKLNLFDLGVDDYVTKPFEIKELLARVHVHIKRNLTVLSTEQYRHKELLLDCNTYSVKLNDNDLTFTRQEFRILEMLLKNPERVFTKQDLYELAWDEIYLGEDKTITVHVSNIRNKLKAHTSDHYIDTVWGIGFRLSK